MLASAITYNILREEDSYLGYSGLGDSIQVTEDDRKLYFSYYLDGSESIYSAKVDGSAVEKITNPDGKTRSTTSFIAGWTEAALCFRE